MNRPLRQIIRLTKRCLLLSALAIGQSAWAGWMAYNDFGTPSRHDNSVTRIGATSAELKAGSGSVEKTGKLIDFVTDQASGIQLKITISGSPLGQAQISGDAPSGTIAGDVFANKANCSGGTPLPAGKVHFIDLTGLDPAKRYELVLFSTAPAGGEAKPVSFTLWDVSSFENRSAAAPGRVSVSGQFPAPQKSKPPATMEKRVVISADTGSSGAATTAT